jgi:hypothetical protein
VGAAPGRLVDGRAEPAPDPALVRMVLAAGEFSPLKPTGWQTAGPTPEAAGAVITRCAQPRAAGPAGTRAALGERLWALVPDDTAEFAAGPRTAYCCWTVPICPWCRRSSRSPTGSYPFRRRSE